MGFYPVWKRGGSSTTSTANETLFKSFFTERGFSDISIDYSNSSIKYCRVDVIDSGNPIFMWPVGARVKLYLSPYFALGRNDSGIVRDGQTPLFDTSDTKITRFYGVSFVHGGSGQPWYGVGELGQESDGRWYVIPPSVGIGEDPHGNWYRLDLTSIYFAFETPFTSNFDIQDYLRRKYNATKTNANSTNSSTYSGFCSMSELATIMGFSGVVHSNASKSAINTPVKIYERVVSNYVCYGFCFGKESHDKTSMAGYSNLLDDGETIRFIQEKGKIINLKNWSWGNSSELGPGAGKWLEDLVSQSFDKSPHYLDRSEYQQQITYTNPTIGSSTDLTTILQNLGATNISGTATYKYDSTAKVWYGSAPIRFKHSEIDAIKTSGKQSPENPSYSYKNNSGFLTLPINYIQKRGTIAYFHIKLDKIALCRYIESAYQNAKSAPRFLHYAQNLGLVDGDINTNTTSNTNTKDYLAWTTLGKYGIDNKQMQYFSLPELAGEIDWDNPTDAQEGSFVFSEKQDFGWEQQKDPKNMAITQSFVVPDQIIFDGFNERDDHGNISIQWLDDTTIQFNGSSYYVGEGGKVIVLRRSAASSYSIVGGNSDYEPNFHIITNKNKLKRLFSFRAGSYVYGSITEKGGDEYGGDPLPGQLQYKKDGTIDREEWEPIYSYRANGKSYNYGDLGPDFNNWYTSPIDSKYDNWIFWNYDWSNPLASWEQYGPLPKTMAKITATGFQLSQHVFERRTGELQLRDLGYTDIDYLPCTHLSYKTITTASPRMSMYNARPYNDWAMEFPHEVVGCAEFTLWGSGTGTRNILRYAPMQVEFELQNIPVTKDSVSMVYESYGGYRHETFATLHSMPFATAHYINDWYEGEDDHTHYLTRIWWLQISAGIFTKDFNLLNPKIEDIQAENSYYYFPSSTQTLVATHDPWIGSKKTATSTLKAGVGVCNYSNEYAYFVYITYKQ